MLRLVHPLHLFVLLLAGARQVIHPPSPIFSSESVAIRVFFMGLLSLSLLAGWQLTRWLRIRTG